VSPRTEEEEEEDIFNGNVSFSQDVHVCCVEAVFYQPGCFERDLILASGTNTPSADLNLG